MLDVGEMQCMLRLPVATLSWNQTIFLKDSLDCLKEGPVLFSMNFLSKFLSNSQFRLPVKTRPAVENALSTGALDVGIERISKASEARRG